MGRMLPENHLCNLNNLWSLKVSPQLVSDCKASRGMRCNMGGSPGDVSKEPVTLEKRKKGWRMSCDVCEATEGLENEL